MASYNSEDAGPIYEFLSKANDYNYQSGVEIDCYCVGYSDDENGTDERVALPDNFKPFKSFYLERFHHIRSFISKELGVNSVTEQKNWDYTGGVDLLLFEIIRGPSGPTVDWTIAAKVESRKLVGSVFQDIDHMARSVFVINSASNSQTTPNNLQPEINRKIAWNYIATAVKAVGGSVIGALVKIGVGLA
jgi:hypothetical protein